MERESLGLARIAEPLKEMRNAHRMAWNVFSALATTDVGLPLTTQRTLTDLGGLLRARPPLSDACTCPPPVHTLLGPQPGGSPVPPRSASPESRWWQAAGLRTESGLTLPHDQARGARGQRQQLNTWIPNRRLVGG